MSLGTVYLTGGSGSFGRAFIRYLLEHDLAERIISVSRNAEMRYRLEQDYPDPRLIVVPGDVRCLDDLEAAYDGPIDVLVSAAAEKHVLTGERHEHYVRSINIEGTRNVVQFARRRQIQKVIALSTDKACRPINAYGRSKAEAERIVTGAGFSCVRYGNVVGSSGSVLPLFLRQRQSGRLTVTDLRMTRFFMPLAPSADFRVFEEPGMQPVISAVELVCYAITHTKGGEVFIPRIPSGTMANLAEQLKGDGVVEEVGIRPGEKLHEDLIAPSEADRCWWLPDDGVFLLMPTSLAQPAIDAERVPVGFSYSSVDDPKPLLVELGVPA